MPVPIPPAAPTRLPLAGSTSPWRLGAAVGRIAVSVGLLLLAFAAYQLWGTGLREATAQEELSARLTAELERPSRPEDRATAEPDRPPVLRVGSPAPDRATGPEIPEEPRTLAAPIEPPAPLEVGAPVASLRIPAIGVDKTVVEGTGREELRTGPGHYVGTARPGHPGNVAIAGHRTTYGAPFHDIDRLEPGDAIVVETPEGVFTYRVEAQVQPDGTESGHRIVAPDEVGVIADRGDDRLTLTACHPLYSARQRIVVTALLEGRPVGAPPPTAAVDARELEPIGADLAVPPVELPLAAAELPLTDAHRPSPAVTGGAEASPPGPVAEDDLGWQGEHAGPTIRWALATAGIALAAWLLGRAWRRWPAYAVAGPTFAAALLTCFAHLDRLLPAA